MDVPTHDELIARLDRFLERHAMTESRLSREATGEPGLVAAIRKGRSPTLETLNRLAAFMAEADARFDSQGAEVAGPKAAAA